MRIVLVILLLAVPVLAAVGLLSSAMITADRSQALAERQRLALWRLDAAFTAIVVSEAGRDPRTWPTLTAEPPVTMRLTVDPNGFVCSVPSEQAQALLLINAAGGWASLLSDLPALAATPPAASPTGAAIITLEDPTGVAQQQDGQGLVAQGVARPAPTGDAQREAEGPQSSGEYGPRSANVAKSQRYANSSQATNTNQQLTTGTLVPRWVGSDLVLVRRALSRGRVQAQVAVLSVPILTAQAEAAVADLFPAAHLEPAPSGESGPDQLAALPLRLVPGAIDLPLSSTARWTLGAAWLGAGIGLAGALTAVLAVWRLGERRAAFVSAVTHELRTPLTSLRLHADLLADPRIGGDPERRNQRISVLRAEAGRLAHLVENVLDYARLERRSPPAPQMLDLAPLLDGIVPRLSERLAAAGLELTTVAPPACRIAGDPEAISRILANLADNAAKYVAGAADLRVELRATLIDRRVELRLRDHGPGLAPDVRARLFIPFARSSEAAAGSAPGVGLGLALCRRLARAMGGDLRLEQPADGGTDAVLVLPLAS